MALALAKQEFDETPKALEPWSNEPETLQELQDRYIIEGKFAGRPLGTTMFLVQAKARDGSLHQVLDGQQYKLFMAPWLWLNDL